MAKHKQTPKHAAKKAAKQKKTTSELVTVGYHQAFLTDSKGKLWWVLAGNVLILTLLLWMALVAAFEKPKPVYFSAVKKQHVNPNDPQKIETRFDILKPVPLSAPSLTRPQLLNWTNVTTTTIYAFNFANAESHLKSIQPFFTQGGWQSFQQALAKSGIVQSVKDRRLIVTSQAKAPPILVKRSVENGLYTMEVRLTIYVKYLNSRTTLKQQLDVDLTIVRVPKNDKTPFGVAISQFVVTNVNRVV